VTKTERIGSDEIVGLPQEALAILVKNKSERNTWECVMKRLDYEQKQNVLKVLVAQRRKILLLVT